MTALAFQSAVSLIFKLSLDIFLTNFILLDDGVVGDLVEENSEDTLEGVIEEQVEEVDNQWLHWKKYIKFNRL